MMFAQDSDSVDYKTQKFIAGLKNGLAGKPDENPQFAEVGGQFGGWLNQQKTVGLLGDSTLKVKYSLVRQGLINAIKGEKTNMTPEQAQEYVQKVMTERHEVRMMEKYGANKEAGDKFLAENAKKEGITTTESGLQYEVIKQGAGAKPTAEDQVKVHYEGKLLNDSVFDSSIERGEPTEFFVNQVIPGWTEGLQLMPVGSKYRFYIPQDLAYGANEHNPQIPPFSTLIFDVELLEIIK
ncbi:MAG: FKBP-type peptidyl-prolyl cis-trans isomerase [Bacteroidales bacterium]|nr:FKBP-type peptidyl-prolyl cis-trans isomerase [Bacteroidales bacterium]